MLSLIRRLDEKSEFKTHAAAPFGRDGGWPILEKMTAALHNEMAAYRASKYAGTEHEYEYTVFIDPAEARQQAQEARAEEDFYDDEIEKLANEFGDT